MDDQQKQLVAKLKDAQNVLVTVSKNPSVDQLSAAIGLTLALNKLDKHATAVYSGQTPSTIEFLKPEETLETNTDSLRDFIIALDKSKADKLRYKVEDQVVRIFITPYRTSITDKDLEFSQGDFNVDVVVALGVKEQTDLDEAITAHGRILHDATVSVISLEGQTELGSLNVVDTRASSLSEITTKLVEALDKSTLDNQISTALLTGIVATTERFSNEKTSPETMSVSARLMSAGANQQLIATELEAEPVQQSPQSSEVVTDQEAAVPPKDPGTLEIDHGEHTPEAVLPPVTSATNDALDSANGYDEQEEVPVEEPLTPQIHVDDDGQLVTAPEESLPQIKNVHSQSLAFSPTDTKKKGADGDTESYIVRQRMVEPPSIGGELTANTKAEELGVPAEELTLPPAGAYQPLLSHEGSVMPHASDSTPPQNVFESEPAASPLFDKSRAVVPPEPAPVSATDNPIVATSPPVADDFSAEQADDVIDTSLQTLSDIEKVVDSPHLDTVDTTTEAKTDGGPGVDAARSAVEAALAGSAPTNPDPISALNAQPLGPQLHDDAAVTPQYQPAPGFPATDTSQSQHETMEPTLDMPLPGPMSPSSPPSAFPGAPNPTLRDNTLPPPPPVPPPPIFPAA